MAFNDLEIASIRKTVAAALERRRPPAHVRHEVDLVFRVTGQSVEIFEVRPARRGPPGEIHELPCAKATFVKSSGDWKVYWMRGDLKWHPYPAAPKVRNIEAFLKLVDEDAHACFFG